MQYGNFNQEAGNVNPFKVVLSAAPRTVRHPASCAWVQPVLMQAVMLWLLHLR